MSTPCDETPDTASPECPTTQRLIAVLEVTGGDDGEVALHLERCESCRQRLVGLAGTQDWLNPLFDEAGKVLDGQHATAQQEPELRRVIDAMREADQRQQQHTQSVI